MDNNPSLSEQQFAEFILAVKNGNVNAVEEIIRRNSIELMNRLEPQFRQPSLYFAALITSDEIASEMIKLLIRYGANVSFKDHNQQTILFYICRDGKDKCAQTLLSHGLSLDEVDVYGQTPIFYAASENQLQLVRRYATKDRVNQADTLAGQTPLYYAAKRGHFEMCKTLIQKGADITHMDIHQKSAAEYAKKAKFTEVSEYLSGQLKRAKDGNKINQASQSIDQSNIEKRKRKDDGVKANKQPYKIVFYNEKGETHDLTEDQVRQLFKVKPQLEGYFANPESIPNQLLESAPVQTWEKIALKILTFCVKQKGSYWFTEPVDPVKYNIMDYFDIVSKPMDLGTVKKKITHNCYHQPKDFISDMQLIWGNCYKYNGQVHQISKCAKQLENAFLEQLKAHPEFNLADQP